MEYHEPIDKTEAQIEWGEFIKLWSKEGYDKPREFAKKMKDPKNKEQALKYLRR